MSKITLNCQECGKEFEVQAYRKESAKFCSRSCKGNWMSKNIVGENHPNYKKPIREETRKKLIDSHKGKKQEPEIIEKRKAHLPRKEKHHAWKGGNIIIKCQQCGREFETKRCWAETRKFCSRACKGIWHSKHHIGENAPRWSGGKIKKQCAECGKDIEIPKSQNLKLNYCSKTVIQFGCQKISLE
jgi:endogenous inhibitor of DNA gyrase (YacG/DUF329 family)